MIQTAQAGEIFFFFSFKTSQPISLGSPAPQCRGTLLTCGHVEHRQALNMDVSPYSASALTSLSASAQTPLVLCEWLEWMPSEPWETGALGQNCGKQLEVGSKPPGWMLVEQRPLVAGLAAAHNFLFQGQRTSLS